MHISRTRLKTNFSRAAGNYDSYAQFQAAQVDWLFAYVQSRIPAQAKIIDIGSGTGRFALLAANMPWRVTGVDLSEAMCRQAKPHMPLAVVGDAAALPFANDTADVAVSSLCLQWIEDVAAAFAELHRVLKPNGEAFLLTLGGKTLRELHEACDALALPLYRLAMRDMSDYVTSATEQGLSIIHQQALLQTAHYTSPHALLHSMQHIGAGNASPSPTRITPKALGRLFEYYSAHYPATQAAVGMVVATWEPLFLHVKKL